MKIIRIESRDNQKIKFARKVRERKIEDLIFVEGARLAEEAAGSSIKITDAFFTRDFAETAKDFLNEINAANLFEVSDTVLASIADTKTPQGVILIGEKPPTGREIIEKTDKTNFSVVVMLHEINNPGNLGAILRTCEAVGASGVVITRNSADPFSPKALRGAMGAAFRIKFWTNADFTEAINWARTQNLTSTCADINAEKSLWQTDWKKPRLIIFGSEAHGLSNEERNLVEEALVIPMENDVESLNLAVSCAVVLFEAKRNFSSKI